MRAASGVVHEEYHSESFAKSGGRFEVVQLWVNLPAREKMSPPRYQTLLDKDIPRVDLPDDAGLVRAIAGEFDGRRGPAQTATPIDLWDVRIDAGKSARFTLPDGRTAVVAVLEGTVEVNGEKVARATDVVVFEDEGGDIAFEANNDAKLILMSGEPIDEPVAQQGPFVMNTQDELRQAFVDYQSGRFGAITPQSA